MALYRSEDSYVVRTIDLAGIWEQRTRRALRCRCGSIISTASLVSTRAATTNTTKIYKSGITEPFSRLKTGNESLAVVHAANSSRGLEEFTEMHFDNLAEGSDESGESNSSSHDVPYGL